jgi:hypothetical protein
MMKCAVVRRRYPLTWLSARRIHGMARTGMLVLVLLGQAITMCGGRGRPSFEMHCLLWCWGRTGRPGRRFIPITPVKGKKRIRRSSGYRVAGACPQVGPLPFKAPPALPIYNGEQDAPLPYRIVCMAGHPRCLLPNLLRSLYRRDPGPGLGRGGFSDRSGVSSDPGLWLRGLGPVCVGLKPGLRVRLCHERFAGSTGSNGGALLWRSFIGSDRQVFRARRQDQRKNIAVFANGMTLPRLARGEDRLRDSFKKLS